MVIFTATWPSNNNGTQWRESVGCVSILSVCRTGATIPIIMFAYRQCTVDDTKCVAAGAAATGAASNTACRHIPAWLRRLLCSWRSITV